MTRLVIQKGQWGIRSVIPDKNLQQQHPDYLIKEGNPLLH